MCDALGLVDIQRNPLGLVEVRTGAKRKRLPTIITMEQYQKLLQRGELGEHCRVMVQLAMCLGLRVSEILGLRWEDADLLNGTVHIQRSVVGKYQDDTKTESSEETLSLHPSLLVAVLIEWEENSSYRGVAIRQSDDKATLPPRFSPQELSRADRKRRSIYPGWGGMTSVTPTVRCSEIWGFHWKRNKKLMRHSSIAMTAR